MSEIQIRRALSPNIAITKAPAPFEVVEAEPEPERRKFSASECSTLTGHRAILASDLERLQYRRDIDQAKITELIANLSRTDAQILAIRDNLNRINNVVEA